MLKNSEHQALIALILNQLIMLTMAIALSVASHALDTYPSLYDLGPSNAAISTTGFFSFYLNLVPLFTFQIILDLCILVLSSARLPHCPRIACDPSHCSKLFF